MARTIRITKAASKATVVEVFENGISTQLMAFNKNIDFQSDGNFIIFPENDYLDRLRLSTQFLHADSVTLLATPADADALLIAMVNQDFFNSN